MTELVDVFSPEIVAAITALVDARVEQRLAEIGRASEPRWLFGDRELAAYLGWSVGRTQKASARGLFPVHCYGQRKSYRTDEIDAAMLNLGDDA